MEFCRSQSQTTFTKADYSKFPSRSTSEIHAGAGTGWGAGRGTAAGNLSLAKGVANLKISESSQNMGSYGRGRTTTNSFWPSRNHAATQSSNHTWRQNLQGNTIPSTPSIGRGQWDSKNWSDPAWTPLNTSNASRRGQGRSHYIPSTSSDSTRRFS